MKELPWIKKYAPESLDDVQGQDKAVSALKDFVRNFDKQSKKALVLFGPSGTGKTSSVYALVNDLDLEIVELNASDFRNKDAIESIVKNSMNQMSLFMKQKLILIDEIDGVSGTKDRGGMPAIINLIKDAKYPIVITANDIWDKKFYQLRQLSQVAEFHTLNYLSVAKTLGKIAQQEKINVSEDDLKTMARRAGGDMRAGINDLQIISSSSGEVTREDIDMLSERDRTEKITNALLKVFKTKDFEIARNAYDDINEDLQQVMMFVDENLPKEYENDDLGRALDSVSMADVFYGRIRRRQDWRYLVYVNHFLSTGVALAKKEKYKKFVQYKKPDRITKLFFMKSKRQKLNSIAEKLAPSMHCSKNEIIQHVLPYLKIMIKKDKNIKKELDLTDEEVSFLTK